MHRAAGGGNSKIVDNLPRVGYLLKFTRKGDRVVDCARLESVCAERHRGFESPPFR